LDERLVSGLHENPYESPRVPTGNGASRIACLLLLSGRVAAAAACLAVAALVAQYGFLSIPRSDIHPGSVATVIWAVVNVPAVLAVAYGILMRRPRYAVLGLVFFLSSTLTIAIAFS
jgi:hypothetical protein